RRRRVVPLLREHAAHAAAAHALPGRDAREAAMISRVRGTLLRSQPEVAEVMTPGGIAYEIIVPLSVYERLPREGAEVELRTVQVVREDAVELFGFIDEHERAIFSRLLTASGVGPRLALAMMSTLAPDRLVRAIGERDTATL